MVVIALFLLQSGGICGNLYWICQRHNFMEESWCSTKMGKKSKKKHQKKEKRTAQAQVQNNQESTVFERWQQEKLKLRKYKKQLILGILGGLLAVGGLSCAAYETWHYEQVKFQNVVLELGTESVSIDQFMTEYARPKQVGFVSDLAEVDIGKVGTYSLTLRHGSQEQTVTLTIQDTTAPTADFVQSRTERIDYEPDPRDFVDNIVDLSETEVYFLTPPELPEDYADVMTTVVVEDASGNKIQEDCVISYLWMAESCTLELGDPLTADMLLLAPEKDAELIPQEKLEEVASAGVGTYEVSTTVGYRTNTTVITVQDTRGPELELQTVRKYLGKAAKLEDFVVRAEDPSGEVTLTLLTELAFDAEGEFPVTIEARDIHGNVTTGETTLVISTDTQPPKLSGLDAMTVEKNSSPDYLKGVSATDKVDGTCKVTYDASGVDVTKAGTYYVSYSASDKAGNTVTSRRKVTVRHDAEDTKALIRSISDSLSNDPEAIRDYVRSRIGYSKNWGGDDPVWYGFTNKTGNCYVHAMCLKAIFDLKGIENQVIWVTDKSHYWLLVKIDGAWKHIDPTPSRLHGRYSLMSDAQRLETLSGRKWDTSLWPACN